MKKPRARKFVETRRTTYLKSIRKPAFSVRLKIPSAWSHSEPRVFRRCFFRSHEVIFSKSSTVLTLIIVWSISAKKSWINVGVVANSVDGETRGFRGIFWNLIDSIQGKCIVGRIGYLNFHPLDLAESGDVLLSFVALLIVHIFGKTNLVRERRRPCPRVPWFWKSSLRPFLPVCSVSSQFHLWPQGDVN